MSTRTALVVDDFLSVRAVLARALERRGWKVFLAASGEEACEILKAHEIDAVAMDLRMPTMSGQTLFHVIVTQWPHLRSRVVIMTGDPESDAYDAWLKLYDLPVISKPFSPSELCGLLDALTADDERREVNGET